MTFASLRGVIATRVGYTGGTTLHPTYKTVCAGDGHTEAIQITYNPDVIDYPHLLEIFWKEHNSTRRAKPQYKSAIWYHNDYQREYAEVFKQEVTRQLGVECQTDIEPIDKWWDAEEYHQKYMEKMRGRY